MERRDERKREPLTLRDWQEERDDFLPEDWEPELFGAEDETPSRRPFGRPAPRWADEDEEDKDEDDAVDGDGR